MYSMYILFLLIFLPSFGDAHQAPKKPCTYRFNVKSSANIQRFDGLMAFYKGTELKLSSGWCLFNDDQEIVTLTIVVINQAPCFENIGNTITSFSLQKNTDARWFRITRRTEFSEAKEKIYYTWEIEEITAKKISAKIPKNAFIIFLDPTFVEGLQFKELNTSHDKNIISLPTLILNKEITQDEFDDFLGLCALELVDIRPLHTAPSFKENRESTTITLLPVS